MGIAVGRQIDSLNNRIKQLESANPKEMENERN